MQFASVVDRPHNIKMSKNRDENGQPPKKKLKKIDQKKMQMIELIREHPILYDLGHIDHKNAQMKLVIWEKIAEILGETGK